MFIGLMDSSFWNSLLYVPTVNKNNGITLATPYVARVRDIFAAISDECGDANEVQTIDN